MRELNSGKNHFKLTDHELAVIQAMAFYMDGVDGMTTEAQRIVKRFREKLDLDNRILSLNVWK